MSTGEGRGPVVDVYVVGIGARTSVGMGAPASAAAVRAGIAGFNEHPFMIDRAGETMVVAMAPYVEAGMSIRDRLLALALPAAREALSALGGKVGRVPAIPVFLGLPPARPGLPGGLVREVVDHLGASLRGRGSTGTVDATPTGHSAGLIALERAWRLLRDGGAEFCLVGGADSYLEPETLGWLEDCDQVHGAGLRNNAWGFIPGEAAGFCLLASASARRRYELRGGCRVLAVAIAEESNLIKTDSVCVGRGLSEAVKRVLTALPPGARVDQVICDMNGEPYRADEFGFTLARTSERFVSGSDFLAPADCWGDVGAASAPLFIGLAAAAGQRGYAKGPHYLIWTSSEGGQRGSALLHLDPESRGRHS
jgi:3-oxoacyl-[acyl-carrier-protein] synthase-1